MDETGARVGCPCNQIVIVPKNVKELYTGSPENRLSITVIETINADGSHQQPFIMLPGQKLMDNGAHPILEDSAWACQGVLPTGYISNKAMLEYRDHFIKFSDSGPRKVWSTVLIDGHKSHYSDDFLIKAEIKNIVKVHTLILARLNKPSLMNGYDVTLEYILAPTFEIPYAGYYASSLVTMMVAGVRIEKTDYRCFLEREKGLPTEIYTVSFIKCIETTHFLFNLHILNLYLSFSEIAPNKYTPTGVSFA